MLSIPPIRTLILTAIAALLAACQSVPAPPPAGFNPAQIAMLKDQGFVETEQGWELTLSERLLFATNESAILPEQVDRLGQLARNLLSVDIDSARVEGHTDSTGSAAYNLRLSRARAETVAAPLTANGMRLSADQVVGRGEARPLSSNRTAEGRQDNRRVVVIVAPQ